MRCGRTMMPPTSQHDVNKSRIPHWYVQLERSISAWRVCLPFSSCPSASLKTVRSSAAPVWTPRATCTYLLMTGSHSNSGSNPITVTCTGNEYPANWDLYVNSQIFRWTRNDHPNDCLLTVAYNLIWLICNTILPFTRKQFIRPNTNFWT